MKYQRFDEFYLTICKEVGNIQNFVESFFDFLSRKTDFYYECFPGDKMGFPPGKNKQIIFSIMDKYQKEHYKKIPQRTVQQYNIKVKQLQAQKQIKNNKTTNISNQPEKLLQPKKQQKVQAPISVPKPKQQQKKVVNPEPILSSYNGGKNQKYTWSQQIRQVQVSFEIQPSLTAKQLKVQLKTDFISIRKATGEVIAQGQLVEKINPSDSVWKIQQTGGKKFVTLNLEKAQERIWATVFKGDPEIDTSKVNNTKPLQEFDDQTQGAIRKIMYQQQRKQMGLPTTEQEKQHQALKQAWNAEGSPFKGQPFDPSLVNFTGSQFNPNP